jgi:hypothetical protein
MGQFVVEAENEQERAILSSFLSAHSDKQWRFWLHGMTYGVGVGLTSFNFGWIQWPPRHYNNRPPITLFTRIGNAVDGILNNLLRRTRNG